VVSLDFLVTYSFRPHHGPGVDSAPSENEYQEHFLGVKVAGAWRWQPHHLHVPNVMETWEPKPPVSQPPGRGINYTGPREVLLEFVILVFQTFFMNKYLIVEIFW